MFRAAAFACAAFPALLGCAPRPPFPFTDVVTTQPSPDGLWRAAAVVEAIGPMAGVTSAVTIGPAGADPRGGQIVLTDGEADQPASLAWRDARTLQVTVNCPATGRPTSWTLWSERYPGQGPAVVRVVFMSADPRRACDRPQRLATDADWRQLRR